MRTLYIECNMGAAGDMLMSALYELMDEEQKEEFLKRMNGLGLPGVKITPRRASTCGISGTHMEVTVYGKEEHEPGHGHDGLHADHHGHEHGELHHGCHGHGHEEMHGDHHGHRHDGLHHAHHHADPLHIAELIDGMDLPEEKSFNPADCCIFSEINPAVVDGLGPYMYNIHTPDEHMIMNTLKGRTALLMVMLATC